MTNQTFQPAANPSIVQNQAARPLDRAHVLVIGNEKGGSGKSTTAMHIVVSLLSDGARVATIDLDARQGTFTRYIENRAAYTRRRDIALPLPEHQSVVASGDPADEKGRFEAALEKVVPTFDYVVIDTPGSDTHLSRLAHTWADTLLTPLNDSFIDLDLLARVDPDTLKIVRPSIYAEAVEAAADPLHAGPAPGRLDCGAQPAVVDRRAQQARHEQRDRGAGQAHRLPHGTGPDRKSTRLNSSH